MKNLLTKNTRFNLEDYMKYAFGRSEDGVKTVLTDALFEEAIYKIFSLIYVEKKIAGVDAIEDENMYISLNDDYIIDSLKKVLSADYDLSKLDKYKNVLNESDISEYDTIYETIEKTPNYAKKAAIDIFTYTEESGLYLYTKEHPVYAKYKKYYEKYLEDKNVVDTIKNKYETKALENKIYKQMYVDGLMMADDLADNFSDSITIKKVVKVKDEEMKDEEVIRETPIHVHAAKMLGDKAVLELKKELYRTHLLNPDYKLPSTVLKRKGDESNDAKEALSEADQKDVLSKLYIEYAVLNKDLKVNGDIFKGLTAEEKSKVVENYITSQPEEKRKTVALNLLNKYYIEDTRLSGEPIDLKYYQAILSKEVIDKTLNDSFKKYLYGDDENLAHKLSKHDYTVLPDDDYFNTLKAAYEKYTWYERINTTDDVFDELSLKDKKEIIKKVFIESVLKGNHKDGIELRFRWLDENDRNTAIRDYINSLPENDRKNEARNVLNKYYLEDSYLTGKPLDLNYYKTFFTDDELNEIINDSFKEHLYGDDEDLTRKLPRNYYNVLPENMYKETLLTAYRKYAYGEGVTTREADYDILSREEKMPILLDSYKDYLKNLPDNEIEGALFLPYINTPEFKAKAFEVYLDYAFDNDLYYDENPISGEMKLSMVDDAVLIVKNRTKNCFNGYQICEAFNRRFTNLLTPQEGQTEEDVLTLDNIKKAIRAITQLQQLHDSRSKLERFFYFFGNVGAEITQIKAMKNMLVQRGINKDVLNDAVNGDKTAEKNILRGFGYLDPEEELEVQNNAPAIENVVNVDAPAQNNVVVQIDLSNEFDIDQDEIAPKRNTVNENKEIEKEVEAPGRNSK